MIQLKKKNVLLEPDVKVTVAAVTEKIFSF